MARKQLGEIVQLVPHRPEHMDFVFDTWLNKWRTSKWAGMIRNCDYFDVTRTLIEDLIARGAKITVAEHPSGEYVGWICYEHKDKPVVHFRYVKDAFLRQGVEERLLAAVANGENGWFTFFDPNLAKDKRWKHEPSIARRKNL